MMRNEKELSDKEMIERLYDPGRHEYLERERSRSGNGFFIPFGKRFCAGCNQHKPKGKRKAIKGWQCDDCRSIARTAPEMDPEQ